VYVCGSSQSDSRRHFVEKTSPSEAVKRSERLRDRRVHYADMVQGIHPRLYAADSADAESKSGETGRHSHHSAVKTDNSLPRPETSGRISSRTSSTERRAKAEVVPVEPMHGTASVNCRRKSMELRSSTDKQMDQVVITPLSVSPAGGRRLSGSGCQKDSIPHVRSSAASKVEPDVERLLVKPATVLNRRHRGRSRHHRRMAARRRTRPLPMSIQLANPSQDSTVQVNSYSEADVNDCSPQSTATTDELKVCSPVESVKFMGAVDASVSEVLDEATCRMLKMDSSEIENSAGCVDSEAAAVKTLSNETPLCVGIDVSAAQASCIDDVEAHRLKRETLLTNLAPVMHVDFASRVGRRHRNQDGIVLLDRYVSVDAPCVRCCSCSQLFTVAEFVRHVHYTNRVDVRSDRRLGPRGVAGPEWHEFQRRRAEFAVGVRSRTVVNLPPVIQATKTTVVQVGTSQVPAGNQCTRDITTENVESAVLAVDNLGKNQSTDNALLVNEDTASSVVIKKAASTPVSGKGTKTTGVEESSPPVLIVEEATKSVSSDVSVGSFSPQKAVVVPVGHPATPDKTSSELEPRVTRSRRTSVGPVETSPGSASRHRQSDAVDSHATTTHRHSERSCKRVRLDSAATTPTQNGGGNNSISSRPELRPRPPPRATTPK